MVEKTKTLPITTIFLFNIKIRIFNMVRWTLELNIPSSSEIDVYAFRQLQRQLFNKGCHIWIGFNGTIPTFNTKYLFRDLHLHVLFDGSLTGQAPAFSRLTTSKMSLFGWQHRPATIAYHALALGTAATTSARRGQKEPRGRQSLE